MSAASYFLPETYKDSLETSRSFITARTHFSNKFIAALIPDTNLLIAVSYSQEFIIFRINTERGGEAIVEQQGLLSHMMQTQIKAKPED